MEPNESHALDWKTCFKRILAPHLLNPSNVEEQNEKSNPLNPSNSEEQNYAPRPLSASNTEEQSETCRNIRYPELYNSDTIILPSDLEPSKNVRKDVTSSIITSIVEKSTYLDSLSESFIDAFGYCPYSDSPDGKLNDSENPIETKDVANIIAADVEELAKNFTPLKVKKKKKNYFNMAESDRKPPDWKVAIKNAIGPESVPESSLTTPEESVDEEPHLLNPALLESEGTNPWTYKLGNDIFPPWEEDTVDIPSQSSSEDCHKKRHYTKEEMDVLKILRSARSFKAKEKPSLNCFDGSGVDCFEDRKSTENTKKPKNVPPPGGYVCVRPLTAEEISKRPINIIATECWDYSDEEF